MIEERQVRLFRNGRSCEFRATSGYQVARPRSGREYLLDTNTLSDLIRYPQGLVAERIAEVGEANVLTSVVVACELRYGAAKRGAAGSPSKSTPCLVR